MKLNQIALIELNEALLLNSIIKELDIDPQKVNPNGGACIRSPFRLHRSKLSVQLFNEMRRQKQQNQYGLVTMCVGTGQGAAGVFEFIS